MDEMIYRDFENKIQKLFAKVIISLDEEGNWSCINNIREGNQFECDVLIEKEERPFAAVEIKYADQAFQSGVRHALRIAIYFKTPYIFVVTKNKFAYLTADGKIIKMHNESITGSDIRKCLTSLGLLRFDSEHWDGKINDLIKKIESSEDDIVRERSEKICEALEHMKFQDVTVAQEEFKVEVKPEIETALFSALLGDYIKEDTNNNEGTVSSIELFYTKLTTPDNRVIVLPNGTLANSSLTNVTACERRRLDIRVGISYDADIRLAKEVLQKVLEDEKAVLKEEEYFVYVDELGESSVNLGIRCWLATDDFWTGKWRLTENVKYALDEAGIGIPYPQMDVHLTDMEKRR